MAFGAVMMASGELDQGEAVASIAIGVVWFFLVTGVLALTRPDLAALLFLVTAGVCAVAGDDGMGGPAVYGALAVLLAGISTVSPGRELSDRPTGIVAADGASSRAEPVIHRRPRDCPPRPSATGRPPYRSEGSARRRACPKGFDEWRRSKLTANDWKDAVTARFAIRPSLPAMTREAELRGWSYEVVRDPACGSRPVACTITIPTPVGVCEVTGIGATTEEALARALVSVPGGLSVPGDGMPELWWP